MMGYFKFPSMTRETISGEGWLSTSDIGQVDESSFMYFNSRTVDVVTNFHGEYVSLTRLEEGVAAQCPALSYVVAFGAKRKNNICLVSLKTKKDADTGRFTDILDGDASKVNPDIVTATAARSDPGFQQLISKAISAYNSSGACLNAAHKVARFAFFPAEPSYESEELTVTQKLKRHFVAEKFSSVIERLYEIHEQRKSLRKASLSNPSASAGGTEPAQ
jgi:long-subunit acyl-CoA synthetase (AMP-forming)